MYDVEESHNWNQYNTAGLDTRLQKTQRSLS